MHHQGGEKTSDASVRNKRTNKIDGLLEHLKDILKRVVGYPEIGIRKIARVVVGALPRHVDNVRDARADLQLLEVFRIAIAAQKQKSRNLRRMRIGVRLDL